MNWSAYLNKMYAPLLANIPGISKKRIEEAIEHTVMHELWENQILVTNFNPDHRAYGPDKPVENRVSAYLTMVLGGRKKATVLWAEKQLGIVRNKDMEGVENGSQPGTLPMSMDAPLRDGSSDGTMTVGDTVADRHNGHEEFEQKQNLARLFASFREYIRTANLKLTHNTLEVLEYMCDRFEGGADKKEVKRELIGNPRFKDRFSEPLKNNSYNYALATWLAAMKEMITDPDSEWYGTPTARCILNAASKREKKEKAQPVAAGLRLAVAEIEEERLALRS